MGSELTVWGLAPEMNHVIQQNSLPYPHLGPLVQGTQCTGAPSAFLGTSLRRTSQDNSPTQLGVGKVGKRRGCQQAEGWDQVKKTELLSGCPSTARGEERAQEPDCQRVEGKASLSGAPARVKERPTDA